MKLKINAAVTYTVEVREVVVDANGEQVWALCVPDERKILMDAAMPASDRRTRLRHEFFHAASATYPGSREDEEHAAEFQAQVNEALDALIEEMGGWKVLDLLYARYLVSIVGTPAKERIVERMDNPTDFDAQLECVKQVEQAVAPSGRSKAGRAQCSVCETIIGDAAIVTGKPLWSPFAGGRVCERQLYCPHCDHVQHWIEGVDLYGEPNGAVASDLQHVKDRKSIEEFLRKNPGSVGLIAGEG